MSLQVDFEDMDEHFGVVKAADSQYSDEPSMDWEKDRSPSSLCVLDDESAAALKKFCEACASKPISDLSRGVTFIWAMKPSGEIAVAVEALAELDGTKIYGGFPIRRNFPLDVDGERKLGHPCLHPDMEARAAGELYLDKVDGAYFWHLNFLSGRYHRDPAKRPNAQQIMNFARHFASKIGMDIHLDLDGDFV